MNTVRPSEERLRELEERAKELHCLYEADEILGRSDPPDAVFEALATAIPLGWQYPEITHCRITVRGRTYESEGLRDSPWSQAAPISVSGETEGQIEIIYSEPRPTADEGPFLRAEKRLLKALADRVGVYLLKLDYSKRDFDQAAALPADATEDGSWGLIVHFLSSADRTLTDRLTRKMLNHLCWTGVRDQCLPIEMEPEEAQSPDGLNRPMEVAAGPALPDLTDRAFRVAVENLGEAEVLRLIQSWISEDKAMPLLKALTTLDTSLQDIGRELVRFLSSGGNEATLPRAVRTALRIGLLRRLMKDQLEFLNASRDLVRVSDFAPVSERIVQAPQSHGHLGGKSAGLFVAQQVLRRAPGEYEHLRRVRVPRTWYISSDVLLDFIHHNDLEDVYKRKYQEIDEVRREYPGVVAVFKRSRFPPVISQGLAAALDDLGEKPLIVRSSSLLEDRTGTSFSGKYKSLFLANQGSKRERLDALEDAIAEVYASVFGPDPIQYRSERDLLAFHEEMGVMIQEVVGCRAGRYYLPVYGGVAFSHNEFRWSPRISRSDGLVRLVPGLGTRAVDRLTDDYPTLLAPGQPGLRVNASPDEIIRYSPRMVDVIDLEAGTFETIPVETLLREAGNKLPMIKRLVSRIDGDMVRPPSGLSLDFERDDYVVTFHGLVGDTPFVGRLHDMLELLENRLGYPVDIEFASDGTDLYLLQCRAQSRGAESAPAPIPRDLPREKVLFTANRHITNGQLADITHVVYVDPDAYGELGDSAEMREIGRAVGRLNKLLPKRQFVLIGPGRWGSRGDIRLGVPVTYADISNTAMLVEVARRRGNYVPDLSFGTHFFQDMVEAGIRYLPLYPDEPGAVFSDRFFQRGTNLLPELLPDSAHLADVVHVIDVPQRTGGQVLKVLMNEELERAVGVLAEPSEPGVVDLDVTGPIELTTGGHWQWRLKMAERIAAELDPHRFGVEALYVLGSTKNATAGPGSDIDLLVHFTGSDEQRRELLLWLEGWSLSLAEINYLRTGYRSEGLLDVHVIDDEDIERRSSYAVKIGAATDPARPLELGAGHRPGNGSSGGSGDGRIKG